MGRITAHAEVVNPSAPVGPGNPFNIFAFPVQVINGAIGIGVPFTDAVLPHAVAATQNAIVILNVCQCWTAPTYDIEGLVSFDQPLALNIGTITTPYNAPLTASGTPHPGAVNQSFGATWLWVDETTIRVKRVTDCIDCSDNCVEFTLQVIEFMADVIQVPV